MIRRGLTTLLFSLLLATTVFAHAGYVRSVPGADAIVAVAPERVEIWFNEELFRLEGENWIQVVGPDRADVTSDEAQIDDDDRSHIWVDLQEGLAAGAYQVTYHTLSADDGDSSEGEFGFTLDPQAQVTSTPMPAETTTAAPPATPPGSTEDAGETADDQGNGGNCLLGLLPLAGILVLAGAATSNRKR
ncbi:MAG: copper resistance protein CopC [Candidatus Promineifilaceae bacterium]|jgi:hypothetical protein